MNVARDDISWRQFGPQFERKCAEPQTIVCARIECQKADRCAKAAVKPAQASA